MRLLRDDLVAHDYRQLRVVLVEVAVDQALEQAVDRWWRGREAGGLGGRFTSPDVIRGMYRANGTTSCAENARRLVDQANAAHLSATLDVASTI